MCLIVFALDAHPELWLVLAANRDEMFARKTAPASFWDDAPDVLAGRDLEKGGTWMGVTRSGRLAALTNYRAPSSKREGASRGTIVRSFLQGAQDPTAYASSIPRAPFPSFNLLVSDGKSCVYASDESEGMSIASGIHGLSNDRLDVSWPKVDRARVRLEKVLARPASPTADAFFDLLADRSIASDDILPKTGVPLEWERALSAAFIRMPEYGTRCSTVVLWHRNGTIAFEERSFAPDGAEIARVTERITVAG